MTDGVDSQVVALLGPATSGRNGPKIAENGAKSSDRDGFAQVLDSQRSPSAERSSGIASETSEAAGGNGLPPARRESAAETASTRSNSGQEDESPPTNQTARTAEDTASTPAGPDGAEEASAVEAERQRFADSQSADTVVPVGAETTAISGTFSSAVGGTQSLASAESSPNNADADLQAGLPASGLRSATVLSAGSPSSLPASAPGIAQNSAATDPLRAAGQPGALQGLTPVAVERSQTLGVQRSAESANASVDANIRAAQIGPETGAAARTTAGSVPGAAALANSGSLQAEAPDGGSEAVLSSTLASRDFGAALGGDLARAGRDSAVRDAASLQSGAGGTSGAMSRSTAFADAMNSGFGAESRLLARENMLSDTADVSVASTRGVESTIGSSTVSSSPVTVTAAPAAMSAANGQPATAPSGVGASDLALERSPSDPEFADEFTARVRVLVRDGVREARLQLHPAELGRLHVTVATEGDQARISFVADTSAAKEAIEQHLPRLRDMLEQHGLQLAQSDVADRGPSSDRGRESALVSSAAEVSESDEQPLEMQGLQSLMMDGSRIDTYI